MNYHPIQTAPAAPYTTAQVEADKMFNAQPVMIGFPTPQGQFAYNPQMLQFMIPASNMQMCYPSPVAYPMSPAGVQFAMPDQNMQMTANMGMHDQVMSPTSPNVPLVFFQPQFNQHPMQQPSFPNMQMGMMNDANAKFGARMSPSLSPSGSMEDMRLNKRTPPGFDNKQTSFARSPARERKPLRSRPENEGSSSSRRRNAKRKSKKQVEKVPDGEYRPSYRSKQDMIDKVFLALSQKYTALGLLENKGLRGDDTIRVHVKNFKALTRIEEALIAVESHPEVKVSRVSLPFSFRNEFQKKGFLVYLKLEDVTMVPHAQSVFRQFDEFKKCGVMRETGQYVESLPLTQAQKPSDSAFTSEVEVKRELTPDYGSSTESSSSEMADSDSEQLNGPMLTSERSATGSSKTDCDLTSLSLGEVGL